MADTDRARMLELGQWLQEFMNPGITAKGYRKMAHDFISFLTFIFVFFWQKNYASSS
jgi:hypothetical protein